MVMFIKNFKYSYPLHVTKYVKRKGNWKVNIYIITKNVKRKYTYMPRISFKIIHTRLLIVVNSEKSAEFWRNFVKGRIVIDLYF